MAEAVSWLRVAFQPVNTGKYLHLLIDHLMPFVKHRSGFIFQHNNDPNDTASVVKGYLGKNAQSGTASVMDWPPQSSDFNIIGAE